MAKRTKTQLLIAGLEAIGYRETERTSKYRVFLRNSGDMRFLVGRSGALRKTERTISESRSATGTPWYQALLEVGRQALGGAFQCPEQAQHFHREELRRSTL